MTDRDPRHYVYGSSSFEVKGGNVELIGANINLKGKYSIWFQQFEFLWT